MNTVALRQEDLPHYNYDDYTQWEGRWELIYGIPYAMAPSPKIKHQRISSKIDRQLGELLKNCSKCESLWPVDWQIAEDIVVQPDVMVVCDDNEHIGETKLEITPVMVFEVLSPASSRKDRVVKYQLYEQAGVKYYCIVDPQTNSAVVFVLQKEKYLEAGEFNQGRMFFDLGPCQIEFDFGQIFE